MRVLKLFLLCLSVLFMVPAFADVQNPVTELQILVNGLQQEVASQDITLQNNPDQLYAVVKKKIIPDMAVNEMAAMALGPKWRTATAAQKQEFIEQFGLMLTRAYASALLKVNQYKIVINPLRTDAWKTAQRLALPGTITPADGGQASTVTYYVLRHGDRWQVYDFAVEGISIMRNFQTQLQSFPTMDAVLTRIKQVNAGQV